MDNLRKLEKLLEERNLKDILIISPENIDYFLDVRTIADSLIILRASRDEGFKLYVPILEYYRFRDSLVGKNVEVFGVSRTIKPSDTNIVEKNWNDLVREVFEKNEKVGVDISHSSPLLSTVVKIGGERIVNVSEDIDRFRMIKDEWEINSIKKAIEITGNGIYRITDNLTEEITETQLAGVFEYNVRREGVEEYAFPPLILFKPSNSYPHNLPSTNKLGDKNLVLVDVGVKYMGRCSDITRMIIWRSISSEEKRALEILEEAIDEAIDHVQPGVKASEVDMKARRIVEKYGFGEKFIHGLGHGFGVVVHEKPYIRMNSETILEPGMVFTIEPGIYVAGRYGVRIEEDVLVRKDGVEVLTRNISRVLT
ncbi:MAG: peptidase M24 [Desulfurococcales archaeon ex4484_58]|nr:MAG: peptidase M24 [Desulfurococcales archaeon ex4484_58]